MKWTTLVLAGIALLFVFGSTPAAAGDFGIYGSWWDTDELGETFGGGIKFAPTDEDIAAIPAAERKNYIIQERIHFTPVIETPHGATQSEIRILYIWTDRLRPMLPLIRMGRGKMMGVDYNKGLRWVGASAGFIV